jgi:hypothetical protein
MCSLLGVLGKLPDGWEMYDQVGENAEVSPIIIAHMPLHISYNFIEDIAHLTC